MTPFTARNEEGNGATRIRPWPNRLGCDVGRAEVMVCVGGLNVRTGNRLLVVDDPAITVKTRIEDIAPETIIAAVERCRKHGERLDVC